MLLKSRHLLAGVILILVAITFALLWLRLDYDGVEADWPMPLDEINVEDLPSDMQRQLRTDGDSN